MPRAQTGLQGSPLCAQAHLQLTSSLRASVCTVQPIALPLCTACRRVCWWPRFTTALPLTRWPMPGSAPQLQRSRLDAGKLADTVVRAASQGLPGSTIVPPACCARTPEGSALVYPSLSPDAPANCDGIWARLGPHLHSSTSVAQLQWRRAKLRLCWTRALELLYQGPTCWPCSEPSAQPPILLRREMVREES